MKILINLLLCLILCFSMIGCGKKDKNPEKITPVKVLTLTSQNFKSYRSISGVCSAEKDILLSSEINGQVEWIGVKIGESVKTGQTVLKIDPKIANAQLQSAKANLNLAQTNFNLQKKLYKKRLISEQQFEAISTQLQVAKANYQFADINQNNAYLKSPINGLIADKFIDENEYTTPGKPVLRLIDIDNIKVNINVTGQDLPNLNQGDKVSIKIPAVTSNVLIGTIFSIAPAAEMKSKTFPVKINIKNPDHNIKSGMLCSVTFMNKFIRDAIIIPQDSILEGANKTVFIIEGNQAIKKSISVLSEENNQVAVSGLEPGMAIITIGQKNIVSGEKIKIIK
jgi:membrane fusion protein, multidrug efflux system